MSDSIDSLQTIPSQGQLLPDPSPSQLSSSSSSSKQSSTMSLPSHKLVPSLTSFPTFLTSYEQNRLRMVKETWRYLEGYERNHSLTAYDRLTSMAARVFKVRFILLIFFYLWCTIWSNRCVFRFLICRLHYRWLTSSLRRRFTMFRVIYNRPRVYHPVQLP